MKHKLTLPIPPSVNTRLIKQKFGRRFILSPDTRNYLATKSLWVQSFMNEKNLKPFEKPVYLDIRFYLPNNRIDSHNLKKVLFDALEQGGLVSNDKYIWDRTQHVEIDKNNPRVEIEFEQ